MSFQTQTTVQTLKKLSTSEQGLTDADAATRLQKHGYNEIRAKKRSLVLLFVAQFKDIMVYILFFGLAVSAAMPFFESDEPHLLDFLDAASIFVILLLNGILGFFQEYKAEQAIEMLKNLTSPKATVRRGGNVMMIPSRDLVPGDIVQLEAGDRISADGRVLTAAFLEMNESTLTGESSSVSKHAKPMRKVTAINDAANMLFSGTLVSRGSGSYVVTETGAATHMGSIASLVAESGFPETPLQTKLKNLGKAIGIVVLLLCALLFTLGLLRDIPLGDLFLTIVSVAVSAVPEGLPAVVTVCLAIGVRRMAKRNALVRRLDALETLGSVTVICADKTGTITENRMKVVMTWVAGGKDDDDLARIAASCNHATLPDIGDPTDIGLLEYAAAMNVKRLPIDADIVPFSSEEKYMRTKHARHEFMKGAPETIVKLCKGAHVKDILKKNRDMADRGLRVLACAQMEKGSMKFVGLIGMEDSPRENVGAALKEAKQAGIRTIMITGDGIDTATAIARQVGIEGDAMMGIDIDDLTDAALQKVLKHTSVFARVSPVHKVRILEALQAQGHIVAMSGDGVNDAPALKRAHVGIAMGKVGTDVSREAAAIVLADDDYSTIVRAIREGRRIYDNIRKFVLFLFRANFGEMILIAASMTLGLPLPYLPLHILWLNLITDSFPALALAMEPDEPDIMKRQPRPANEHILSGQVGTFVIAALCSFAFTFLFYLWQLSSGVTLDHARTTTFLLAICIEFFLAFSSRSQKPVLSIGIFSNRWLLMAIGFSAVLQCLILLSPARALFSFTQPSLREYLTILFLAAMSFCVFETMKVLQQYVRRRT